MLSNPLPTGLRSNLEIGKYKTERLITADQSNQSVVIDESIIIKWQLVAEVSQDAKKQELLSKNGFTQLPKLLGNIYWQDYLIASVNRYIKEAQDGWSWCVDYAKSGDSSSWVDQLAQLTNQMHLALAGEIHGDFHIGQILKTKDSQNLWVIDFEGDPMGNNDEAPNKLRDIASMCGSFFHVGAVAIKYGADSKKIKKWIIDTQERYLANYFGQQPFDLQQLQRLIRSLEDRELEYADKFLTYWRYAPEFAISYMKELGYGSN
jgi:predicted trehalose synthase